MRSCCRGSACTGRACVAGRWGPGLLRRARCVRSANGRRWCWGHRIGHGVFRIRPARRRDRRTAGPLPARGRVRGDALSTCMDCGLVSGACLWLSCIRRTTSRRRPGGGNRRWSIPCTSIPHHHVIAGLACLPLLVYAHSDVEWAERVRYAVQTGRCYVAQGVRRIQGGYEKGSNQVTSV